MEMFRPSRTRIVNSFNAVVLVLMLPVLLTACGGGAEAETQASSSSINTTSPDTTSPVLAITGPTSASSYSTSSATVVLSGTASDDVGVTQVAWSNSRGGSGTAGGTVSWNSGSITLQGGSNTLTVTARDAAGNTATDTLVITYSTSTPGDTTAPSISIGSPTSSATYTTTSSSLSLGGTASDNVGVTQVTWSNSRGGSGTASGTSSWSVGSITLQSGSNVITVTARDAAGNVNTDTLTVTYNAPDTTNPTVTIGSPTSSATYTTTSSSLSLGGTASDNVGVTQITWSNNRGGSGTASGTSSWSIGSITLQSGSNVITVTARDAAGNVNTDTLTVTYNAPDTTNPTVTIGSPTSSATYTTTSSSLSLGGTASDNVGVTQVTWSNSRGGSGTASGTTAWSVSGITLSDGSNTLTVTARDAAGNVNTDTLTVTYNAPVTSNSAILTWDAVLATNLSGYRVYYGTAPGSYQQAPGQGLSVGNITTYTLMGLSNGTRYYFAVTAIDTTGNESGYSNEVFKDIP